MFRSFALSITAFCIIASSNLAQADSSTNIFKAETSNLDLLKTIEAFQDVCLTFILHETQLTQHSNRLFHMESKSFKNSSGSATRSNPENFTVFAGFPGVSADAAEHPEIALYRRQNRRQTGHLYKEKRDIYRHDTTPFLQASLLWSPNLTQKQPAKSCEISLEGHSISKSAIIEDVIEKDLDWKNPDWQGPSDSVTIYNGSELIELAIADIKEPMSWSQCTQQEGDNFLFSIKHDDSRFSINVQRNPLHPFHKCIPVTD